MVDFSVRSCVEKIGLFFRVLLLDPIQAQDSALKVSAVFLDKWRHLVDSAVPARDPEALAMQEDLINLCRDQLQAVKKTRPSSAGAQFGWHGLLGVDSLDSRTWHRFLLESGDEEALALVWSQVLRIPDEVIAKSLSCSTGTVVFRVGKAIRHLGLLEKAL